MVCLKRHNKVFYFEWIFHPKMCEFFLDLILRLPLCIITLNNLYNLINAFCSITFLNHIAPPYCQNVSRICSSNILQHKPSHFTYLAFSFLRACAKWLVGWSDFPFATLSVYVNIEQWKAQVLTQFLSFSHRILLLKITLPVMLPFRSSLCLKIN